MYKSRIENSIDKLLRRLEFWGAKSLSKKEFSLLKVLLTGENRVR